MSSPSLFQEVVVERVCWPEEKPSCSGPKSDKVSSVGRDQGVAMIPTSPLARHFTQQDAQLGDVAFAAAVSAAETSLALGRSLFLAKG